MNRQEKKAKRFATYQEDPLLTSKLVIDLDQDVFTSKYGIISFQMSDDKERFSYASLSGMPVVSVTGLSDLYPNTPHQFTTRYFVLVERKDLQQVRDFLGQQKVCGITTGRMIQWNERIRKRVIASLALNSLGRLKQDQRWMYHEGSLLLFDEINFKFNLEKKGLVCLKLEINRFLTLIARTQTYSHPESLKELKERQGNVFQLASALDGELWTGKSLKPVVLPSKRIKKSELEQYYIKKAMDEKNRNVVPHWPFAPENYVHGKLFVMWEALRLVNEVYAGMLKLHFNAISDYTYDEYASDKKMTDYLVTYLKGKEIRIVDPFQTHRSRAFIEEMVRKWQDESLMDGDIHFTETGDDPDMVISLCEEKEKKDGKEKKKVKHTYYHKLQERSASRTVQHVVLEFPNAVVKPKESKKDHTVEQNADNQQQQKNTKGQTEKNYKNLGKERRILLELMVKDCIRKRRMPAETVEGAPGWTFWEYRLHGGKIVGSWLRIHSDGELEFGPFYTSMREPMMDFNEFVYDVMYYTGPTGPFSGSQDYKVLTKEGNVFMIITSDEVPILDGAAIDAKYERINGAGEKLSDLKRADDAHRFFRGYVGFHFWEVEPFDKVLRTFAYISGTTLKKLQTPPSKKLDKLPHMRLLLVLHAEHPDLIEEQVTEITGLLKYGLGRWQDMMTYPYPYKFLSEYLDNETECLYGFHWQEVCPKRINDLDKSGPKKSDDDIAIEPDLLPYEEEPFE